MSAYRKEQVKKAITMQGPDYIPLLYSYALGDSLQNSDIIPVDVEMHLQGPGKDTSEWGFKWDSCDRSLVWGQVKAPPLQSWDDLARYTPPDPAHSARFETVNETRKRWGEDRYYVGNLMLSGFTVMGLLRGFANLLEDIYLNRDHVEKLADIVFGFEESIMARLPSHGFDAVALADDFGSQQSLFMPPRVWREVFKPRFRHQCQLAHSKGLAVFLHSCGYIYDIIPDLIEVGIDMLNPSQPKLNGIKRMGEQFQGKICFVCPVSYQTTGITGTREDVFNEVRDYVRYLGSRKGGLIGFVNTDVTALGASAETAKWIVDAFESVGGFKGGC